MTHRNAGRLNVFFVCASLCVVVGGCPEVPELVTTEPTRARLAQADIDSGEVTLAELIDHGRDLVLRNWTLDDGFGKGSAGALPMVNRLPGPDSSSCMSCHGLGNGVVLGWGNNGGNVLVEFDNPLNPTITGSNERSTPAIHGAVLLELLAKEMSADLQVQRDAALAEAESLDQPVTRALSSKGVSFGSITADPDGTLDTTTVEGVSEDLRVRPFHAKGHDATIRIFTRDALNRHHSIQATERLIFVDPNHDPATWDADQDGVVNELSEGELTAMTVYQVSLPIPQEVDPDAADVMAGRGLMESTGCTDCHKPFLKLNDPTWRYTSSDGVELSIDLTDPMLLGAGRPLKEADGSVLVRLWGDLKRYDLGTESHEPLDQPVGPSLPNHESGTIGERIPESLPMIAREMMLTTELWGVRDTGPWWHDGSSLTLEDSILRHAGDAEASRVAYEALTEGEQADLLAFLASLQVAQVGEVLVTAPMGLTAAGADEH
jgi:hypothetical protein